MAMIALSCGKTAPLLTFNLESLKMSSGKKLIRLLLLNFYITFRSFPDELSVFKFPKLHSEKSKKAFEKS